MTSIAILVVTVFYVLLTATALGWLRWIRGRWLVTLGALSYPVYLLHNEIGRLAIRELPGHSTPPAMWIFIVGGILLLSYLAAVLSRQSVDRTTFLSKVVRTRLLASFEAIRSTDRPGMALLAAPRVPAMPHRVLLAAPPEDAPHARPPSRHQRATSRSESAARQRATPRPAGHQ